MDGHKIIGVQRGSYGVTELGKVILHQWKKLDVIDYRIDGK